MPSHSIPSKSFTFKQSFGMLKRLWCDYAKPYRLYIYAAIPCAMLAGGASAVQAYLFQPAIDQALIAGDSRALWFIPLLFLLVSLARGLASYAQTVLIGYAAERIVVGLQGDIFAKLLRLDMAFFHQYGESPQVGRFLTDVRFVREGAVKFFTALPKETLSAFGMLGVLVYHSPMLSGIVLVIVPLFFYPIFWIGRRMREIARRTQNEAGRLTAVLDQSLAAVRQIKIAGRYDDESLRAGAVFDKMQKFMVKMICYEQLLTPMNELLKAVCFGFSVIFGGYLVQQGEMSVGSFTSFMIALIGIFSPIRVLSKINSTVQAALAGMESTFMLLDRAVKIRDPQDAVDLQVRSGRISFRDVRFGYNDETDVLSGVNLDIPGGSRCALVGLSGSGKSTALSLLPRFIDPVQGQVLIDDQDLRTVSLASIHQNMAYVSQEVELFDLSLRENLCYTYPDATDTEITEALEQVGLTEFTQSLPDGLDTMIGENGVRLSGGQRQRIAFARALMKRAPIILMDEATSALDSKSEQKLQQAIEGLDAAATVVIVAHRLSTVMRADMICVLHEGTIIEQGTHDALSALNGMYAQFCRGQWADKRADQKEA